MKTQYYDLFKVSLGFYERLEALSEEEISLIKKDIYEKNLENTVGVNQHFLESKGMEKIKEFCTKAVNDYYSNHMQFAADLEIVLSWTNKTKNGEMHHLHNHPCSAISGVFYLQDTLNAPISFLNPTHEFIQLLDDTIEYNQYNSNTFKFAAANGNCCIVFPSYLKHEVLRNKGDTRYSLAFNAFYKKGTEFKNRLKL